jgi:GNAT superfamily N-acetyltransferase
VELYWDPDFEMGQESAELAMRVWPPFLTDASDLPQPGLELEIDADVFLQRYPAWGLRDKVTGQLVAYTNAVYIYLDPQAIVLPEAGWQYAIQAGTQPFQPNGLCLVVANVDPSAQSKGVSLQLIEKAKAEARGAGLDYLWAPVRPSNFHDHPELTFEAYVELKRPDGLPADPWLRVHTRAGAEKLNICRRSAVVTATPQKWSQWTSETYSKSGSYPLARGLAPLEIDLEKNIGTYIEPNVWFRYRL